MFSQFKNKPLFSDRGDKGASRVNSSTFVYLLIEYYLSEMGNSDYNKMKALGEQLGPRIYEALHYSKENKYSYKRFLTPLESIKFIAMAVWPFLFEKQAEPSTITSVHYTIYESDYPGLKDKVTGSFYAGVLQGMLNYAGVECEKVDFKCQFKDKETVTLFEIYFNEKFKNETS